MAAGNTYTPIYSTVLASNTNTISLSSFSGYTDLRIVITVLTTGNNNMIMKFNGATSGYEQLFLGTYGQSGSTYYDSGIYAGLGFMYVNAGYSQNGNTIPGIVTIDIPYYSDTSTYTSAFIKWGYSEGSASTPRYYGRDIMFSQWRSNAGVSSIDISMDTGASYYAPGTVVEVYGIKEA